MTKDEAIQECRRLQGLFPQMTPEQGIYWRDEFQKYPRAAARRAVDRHVREHEFLSTKQLLELIRVEVLRDTSPPPHTSQDDLEDEWRVIADTLAGTPPADLARMKAQVLDELRPESREFLLKCNPLTSRTLQGLIWNRFFTNAGLARHELSGSTAA